MQSKKQREKTNEQKVNENVKAKQAVEKEGAKRRSWAHLLLDQRNQLRERERGSTLRMRNAQPNNDKEDNT